MNSDNRIHYTPQNSVLRKSIYSFLKSKKGSALEVCLMIVELEVSRLGEWASVALRLKGAHNTGNLWFLLQMVTRRDF